MWRFTGGTGHGNGTVTFTVAANGSSASRSGEIFSGEPEGGGTRRTFNVNQAGSK